jgi:glycosyltransferase involved in cell wall biosynthesis
VFYPIEGENSVALDFKAKHNVDFVVFWNSRNIRRKQPGDIILAFKNFCDKLTPDQAKRCCLFMKTHVQDPNGTDLMAVKDALCPNYKVIFSEENLPQSTMNAFYNLADVTVNFSSAEGFGLGIAESLMAGTMIIAPVHGGLQDQMGFKIDGTEWQPTNELNSNSRKAITKCGEWAIPIFPRARQLQGSIPTPYIFDYVCDADDLTDTIMQVYQMSLEERKTRGLAGREFMLQNLSSELMNERFIKYTNKLFETWKPKPTFTVEKIHEPKNTIYTGLN